MKRRLVGILTFAAVALIGAPSSARADVLLTPFAGVTFGGDASNGQATFGGSLAYMGAGILGAEVDFGFSPDFFKDDNPFNFTEDEVTSFMVNLILGAPIGGSNASVRPYVSGGGGLLRSSVRGVFSDISNSDFGINVGAGVMGFFNDRVGLRGDIRYFRSLSDPVEDNEFDVALGNFNFIRGTVGVVFKF